ncbi:hypothetical protein P154DRAFT_580472 [Amniculicola lignicola CBS 123094]|uniref:Uncharacterized protein n=1 Tax=Amniculicola lignicola CBS 123094 TaxID=1392246 RepID=A0A6A5W1V9_9PLEO|nr:hypothetical protein P154DRAFT_580472 [Amniculicola lignicola CBS 123094]
MDLESAPFELRYLAACNSRLSLQKHGIRGPMCAKGASAISKKHPQYGNVRFRVPGIFGGGTQVSRKKPLGKRLFRVVMHEQPIKARARVGSDTFEMFDADRMEIECVAAMRSLDLAWSGNLLASLGASSERGGSPRVPLIGCVWFATAPFSAPARPAPVTSHDTPPTPPPSLPAPIAAKFAAFAPLSLSLAVCALAATPASKGMPSLDPMVRV